MAATESCCDTVNSLQFYALCQRIETNAVGHARQALDNPNLPVILDTHRQPPARQQGRLTRPPARSQAVGRATTRCLKHQADV